MEKLDMFQTRFGKLDEFGWWDLEQIKLTLALILPRMSFNKAFMYV